MYCKNWGLKELKPIKTKAKNDIIKAEEGRAMEETHDEVIRVKNLPKVGQTVRSKKYGTLWRVMEKREVWLKKRESQD